MAPLAEPVVWFEGDGGELGVGDLDMGPVPGREPLTRKATSLWPRCAFEADPAGPGAPGMTAS